MHTPHKPRSMVPKTTKILQRPNRVPYMRNIPTQNHQTSLGGGILMQATSKQKTPTPPPTKIKLIGTQTGQCQICKQTKQLLILKYGFSLCEDCLSVCIGILEHLQNGANQKTPVNPGKACPPTSKKFPVRKTAATKNAQASTPK